MAIDTTSPNYGTADNDRNKAVQDVDVSQAGPGGQASAQAQVVTMPSGGGVNAPFVTVGPPSVAAPTSGSGTITLGGTSQTLFAANAARKGWAVQNQSVGDLYVLQSTANPAAIDNTSFRIPPGFEYTADYVNGLQVKIIGATTGQAFWARAW